VIAYILFQRHGLFKKFNISIQTFLNFFWILQGKYLHVFCYLMCLNFTFFFFQNTYQSSIHAADVMQFMHFIVTQIGPHTTILKELELLTAFLATAAHDVGHPGFNNDFLVKTQHEYALIYNNQQCLENFHCANVFLIMKHFESADILANLTSTEKESVRKTIIEMILATDLKMHFRFYLNLKLSIIIIRNCYLYSHKITSRTASKDYQHTSISSGGR
jgi:cAMP-specific phosphodiesterase 4